jgi:hypothetical protein
VKILGALRENIRPRWRKIRCQLREEIRKEEENVRKKRKCGNNKVTC